MALAHCLSGCLWRGPFLPTTRRRSLADSAAADAAGYNGRAEWQEVALGPTTLALEVWPDFRIGSTSWPSGRLLALAFAEGAQFLPDIAGKQVAELGAGTGLPGLMCGMLGATRVTLTDRDELVPLLRKNIVHNGLTGVCHAEALDWSAASQSPLAACNRGKIGALDVVLAADVVYFEEQDPLIGALVALMAPEHTVLVLAYRERTFADREYLVEGMLPFLTDVRRSDYGTPEHGSTEIYVGRMRAVDEWRT